MHLNPDPMGDQRPETIHPETGDESAEARLTCPSCGADLIGDERFVSHRVCGACGRHFAIGARERIALLVDTGVFQEFETSVTVPENTIAHDQLRPPSAWPSTSTCKSSARPWSRGSAALVVYAVIVALDDHLVTPWAR